MSCIVVKFCAKLFLNLLRVPVMVTITQAERASSLAAYPRHPPRLSSASLAPFAAILCPGAASCVQRGHHGERVWPVDGVRAAAGVGPAHVHPAGVPLLLVHHCGHGRHVSAPVDDVDATGGLGRVCTVPPCAPAGLQKQGSQ